jgi:hypothetical protein
MAAPTFVSDTETAWNTTTSPKTTSTISVNSGDILVACMVAANELPTTTVSGGSLSWTTEEEVNVAAYTRLLGSRAVASANLTVSFTRTAGTAALFGGNVLCFRSSDGVGASEKGNASGAAPTLNITTTQDNSAIVCFVGDWNAVDGASRTWRTVNSITPTAGNGYELSYFRDAAEYTLYVAYYPDAGTAGAKTVGLSAPSGQKYSIVAIEVKGTSSSVVDKSGSDTGGGADAWSAILAALARAETASGSDARSALAAVLGLSDTAAGTDAKSALLASFAASDTGAGADAYAALLASFAATETGAGADAAGSLAAAVGTSETGAGADAYASLAAALSRADTAAGTEGTALVTVGIVAADVGAGTEDGGGVGAMPTYGAQASDVIGPSASISVAYPTGTAAGKTLVYLLAYTNTATISTPPAGFTAGSTQVNGTRTLALYTRVCDGSESGSVSVTLSASVRRVGAMLLFDATAATPIDLAGFATGTGTTGTAPAITTTGDNRLGMRVLLAAGNAGAITTPSTSRLNVADGTGVAGVALAASTESFTTAGTTSTAAFTWGVSVDWIACTLALSPPGGSGGASIFAIVQASDTGGGGDVSSLDSGATPKAGTETGTGTDAVASLVVVLATSETAAGSDVVAGLLASLTRSDTGSGGDVSSLDAGATAKAGADTAAGTDAVASLVVVLAAVDVGIGLDDSTLDTGTTTRTYPTFFIVAETDVQGYRVTESRGDWTVIEDDPLP